MALTERKVVDLIEVLERGQLQIREANLIEKDNVVVAKTLHRYILTPGDDVSQKEQRIKDIAAAVWTPEVIAFWQAKTANI